MNKTPPYTKRKQNKKQKKKQKACVWWCPTHIVLCFLFCSHNVYVGVLYILYCVFVKKHNTICKGHQHTHKKDKTKNIIQNV
jgi:hypothetical protein